MILSSECRSKQTAASRPRIRGSQTLIAVRMSREGCELIGQEDSLVPLAGWVQYVKPGFERVAASNSLNDMCLTFAGTVS